MSEFRLGFIGAGNMGEAIINGALLKDVLPSQNINIYDVSRERLIYIGETYRVNACLSMEELIEKSDIIILAIKPQVAEEVLPHLASLCAGKAVISIMAGWTLARYAKFLGESVRFLRVMPNTPAMCGEGMSALSAENTLQQAELAFSERLFSALGEVEFIPEKYFDAVTAISGSGPSYMMLILEAMTSGGVQCGLSAPIAKKLAIQTMLGSAQLAKQSDTHPAILRDAISSPGGTTIEALKALELHGVRGAFIAAVEACAQKSKLLSEQ